jgi:hypothetical protein
MTVESRTFQLSAEVYTSLRACCEELREILTGEEGCREGTAVERSAALRDGFGLGVLAATLALQGQTAVSEKTTPEEAKKPEDPRSEASGQMKLFD